MNARRVVVKGKVQGVGFRAYVLSLARGRGLAGEVWSRADGAVEIVAVHGDDDVLNRPSGWEGIVDGLCPGKVVLACQAEAEKECDYIGYVAPNI
ncbi:MAG: acylphosphatase [Fimbriimonadaceae bacterium]|nr:acylphosphatase [Fimbriimonadaceae bacterium]